MAAFFLMNNDVCSLLHHRQLTDCLAVDSGFAYYSLSSIFITEYRGAELGTIALLAKTTLPIITQTVGQRYVALSIYHGFVTDFTVPFVVTMWCTLA